MKISDLTPAAFERAMMDLMNQSVNMEEKLAGAFEKCELDAAYPFPLAEKVKTVWQYAAGQGDRPADMDTIIQELCDLAWCPVLATGYDIPASWWHEPLGFMCMAAWAREKLDTDQALTPDELGILGEVSRQTITRALLTGRYIKGKKVGGLWQIPPAAAREYLKRHEDRGSE